MPLLTPRARAVRAVGGLLSVTLLLAGCGGATDDDVAGSPGTTADPSPATGDVEVPEGVELTEPGTELDLGDAATVAYQVGRDRGSVVELAVTGVSAGDLDDLSAFQLDEATQASALYYVQVDVTNVGAEDVGGAAVPLFAVDGRDVLVQPSTFTTSFERCPSTALPEEFAPGAEVSTCLVYLLPEQGELRAVSYRPLQDEAPITWTGEIEPADQPEGDRPEDDQSGEGDGADG